MSPDEAYRRLEAIRAERIAAVGDLGGAGHNAALRVVAATYEAEAQLWDQLWRRGPACDQITAEAFLTCQIRAEDQACSWRKRAEENERYLRQGGDGS